MSDLEELGVRYALAVMANFVASYETARAAEALANARAREAAAIAAAERLARDLHDTAKKKAGVS